MEARVGDNAGDATFVFVVVENAFAPKSSHTPRISLIILGGIITGLGLKRSFSPPHERRLVRSISVKVIIRLLPAIFWMLLIFVLSAQHQRPGSARYDETVPQTPSAASQSTDLFDIVGHLVFYAVLAVCLWWSLGLLVRLTWWGRLALAFTGAVLYGLTDEWHQSYVSNRQASSFDLQVDAVGALAAVVLIAIMHWPAERSRPTS